MTRLHFVTTHRASLQALLQFIAAALAADNAHARKAALDKAADISDDLMAAASVGDCPDAVSEKTVEIYALIEDITAEADETKIMEAYGLAIMSVGSLLADF